MTSIIEIFAGDFLYVLFPETTKARRVKVVEVEHSDVIYGALYDRSLKQYRKEIIDLKWVTGVKLISRKSVMTDSISAILVYEELS